MQLIVCTYEVKWESYILTQILILYWTKNGMQISNGDQSKMMFSFGNSAFNLKVLKLIF